MLDWMSSLQMKNGSLVNLVVEGWCRLTPRAILVEESKSAGFTITKSPSRSYPGSILWMEENAAGITQGQLTPGKDQTHLRSVQGSNVVLIHSLKRKNDPHLSKYVWNPHRRNHPNKWKEILIGEEPAYYEKSAFFALMSNAFTIRRTTSCCKSPFTLPGDRALLLNPSLKDLDRVPRSFAALPGLWRATNGHLI